MFIPFTVIFQDIDQEEAELTGKKPKKIRGESMININLICSFNENDNGNTHLRMANGEIYETIIKYKELKDTINTLEENNILISGNN